MLIAISQRNDKNKHGDGIDNLENSYTQYWENQGATLIPIPNYSKDVDSYFDLPIKGIILSGGNDIDPSLYGSDEEVEFSKARDGTEKRLLEIAIDKKIPVLGICRGMQFINVFFKGKLVKVKDVSSDVHVRIAHMIDISEHSDVLVNSEINSFHNKCVTEEALSSDLKVFAKTSDGLYEGIFHPSLPIVGIQWHPERKNPDNELNEKLAKAFLENDLFWK